MTAARSFGGQGGDLPLPTARARRRPCASGAAFVLRACLHRCLHQRRGRLFRRAPCLRRVERHSPSLSGPPRAAPRRDGAPGHGQPRRPWWGRRCSGCPCSGCPGSGCPGSGCPCSGCPGSGGPVDPADPVDPGCPIPLDCPPQGGQPGPDPHPGERFDEVLRSVDPMAWCLAVAGERPVGSIRSCRFSAASPLGALIVLVGGLILLRRHAAAWRRVDRIRRMVFQNRWLDVLIARLHPNVVRRTGRAAPQLDLVQHCDLCCLAGRPGGLGRPDLPRHSRGELHPGRCRRSRRELHLGRCQKRRPVLDPARLDPARDCPNPRCLAGAGNQTVFEGP